MNTFRYKDLKIGMKQSFHVKITQAMMDAFYVITGDSNPLHRDLQFAQNKGYKDCVVYGMLSASFLSTLAGVYLPGERSLIHSVDTSFLKPVFAGDTLNVVGEIVEMEDTVKRIILKVSMHNQNGIKVLKGKMKIGVLDE